MVRMRVHVNGRLPLITSSILEYPNGDEVEAKLVYEKIGKHCSCCFRLDHDLRDCLRAKAEKREAQTVTPDTRERSQSASSPGRRSTNTMAGRYGVDDRRYDHTHNREPRQELQNSESQRYHPRNNREVYGKNTTSRHS
ncbi:unnamed protein product [Brassica oleracea var. botrytis]